MGERSRVVSLESHLFDAVSALAWYDPASPVNTEAEGRGMYVWTAELAANALRLPFREERLLTEKRLKRDQKSNVVLLSQGSHPEEIFGRRPLNRMEKSASVPARLTQARMRALDQN